MNGNDDGPGSLRQFILDAGDGDTIKFNEDVKNVFLTSAELLINKSIVITGNQGNTAIERLDSSPKFRIIHIFSLNTLLIEFRNLIITGGNAPDGVNASIDGQNGGGIFIPDSIHELKLINCIVENNKCGDGFQPDYTSPTGRGGYGGGIYSMSMLNLENCLVNGNAAGKGADAWSGWTWYGQNAGSGGVGGGIFCTNDMTLLDCIFTNNKCGDGGFAFGDAYSMGGNGGSGGSGGAVFCKNSSISITNTNFMYNNSGNGGSASNYQASVSGGVGGYGGALYLANSDAIINYSEISENSTGHGGGAGGNESGYGNHGGNGGGLYCSDCDLNLKFTEIRENLTGSGAKGNGPMLSSILGNSGSGGGIFLTKSSFDLEDCLLIGNYTSKGASIAFNVSRGGNGGNGGGIYINEPSKFSRIRNCRFFENRTGDGVTVDTNRYFGSLVEDGANGGSGGGLYIENSDSLIMIIGCIIKSNLCGNSVAPSNLIIRPWFTIPKGGSGGGIYNNNANTMLINSTITDNSTGKIFIYIGDSLNGAPTDTARGKGGGIIGIPVTKNSIIAYNYLENYNTFNDLEGLSSLDHSLISTDTLAEFSGTGNLINFNPYFFDFPDSLSLTAASFAINNGNPDTSGLFLPELDIAGNPRIYGDRIDMGAYEFQGEPEDQWVITTDTILMDTIIVGSSTIDSLCINNYGSQPLIISSISVNSPFSLSLDKTAWSSILDNISIPSGDPFFQDWIYIKFEAYTHASFTDSISITIGDSVNFVYLRGICKSNEGIKEEVRSITNIYPNPFTRETRISFLMQNAGDVKFTIIDFRGIRVDEFTLKNRPSGLNSINWKAGRLPGGIYTLYLQHGKRTDHAKLIFVPQ